jgi:NAD(P)-dependent dehydrogenase (short-subunit alcohol dehydrogenase family)
MSRTGFITGSSRGFGRSLTLAALRDGDRIAATARKPQQLSDVVEEFGSQVLPLALDITDEAAVVDALDATQKAFGSVDVCLVIGPLMGPAGNPTSSLVRSPPAEYGHEI